ncbi:hypothetical protein AB0L05_35880 [Nonomuraea pusilla]|uniref:hypothetical protein n=1 Tax=Nonomuraea pusilla TaxID=46177 RepID=UPI003317A92A
MRWTVIAPAALMPAALVLASACGAAVPAVPTGPAVSQTEVGLTEWHVGLGASVFAPGPVELHVTNAGSTAHDLVVTGPGVSAATPVLPPGGTFTLRFTAVPGARLTLLCTVAGHDHLGMRTDAVVAASAGAGT